MTMKSKRKGIFEYVYSGGIYKSSNLIHETKKSNVSNQLQSFQPQTSLQYGEVLFYSFAHILQRIENHFINQNAMYCVFFSLVSVYVLCVQVSFCEFA